MMKRVVIQKRRKLDENNMIESNTVSCFVHLLFFQKIDAVLGFPFFLLFNFTGNGIFFSKISDMPGNVKVASFLENFRGCTTPCCETQLVAKKYAPIK